LLNKRDDGIGEISPVLESKGKKAKRKKYGKLARQNFNR
jgi:hypothetical protein